MEDPHNTAAATLASINKPVTLASITQQLAEGGSVTDELLAFMQAHANASSSVPQSVATSSGAFSSSSTGSDGSEPASTSLSHAPVRSSVEFPPSPAKNPLRSSQATTSAFTAPATSHSKSSASSSSAHSLPRESVCTALPPVGVPYVGQRCLSESGSASSRSDDAKLRSSDAAAFGLAADVGVGAGTAYLGPPGETYESRSRHRVISPDGSDAARNESGAMVVHGDGQSMQMVDASRGLIPVPKGQRYVDVTNYLNMSQTDAAKQLKIPASTLSKRWKEAVRNRKWPYRRVQRLDKEITTLLHNVPQGPNAPPLPKHIEEELARLLKLREKEMQQVIIRL
mmetsp:Transcript_43985/g.110871  ORF Transcript_43985/g.110871 Transcript_43985/m.110871 type:complete len:341 (+) Transcript_43985:135-1157(+)|eukprot:CAMPEP_0177650710 /NCGR_PEP_ID=MMETSP0447-20121125/12098_1 /TAXON_ID=0 /ORGANISM="Stygamoeba regulata, Strain BSH-02190019" /LENGTH=340 /DNA_ID=CAMNT_0019153619 /DNA_START=198 /DNA_END=1220 /DNA_ORIENTATION=+